MADADVLFREGDVEGARAALVARVKAVPTDIAARMFLFQLFALIGEWAKARNQLEMLAQLSPAAQMLSVAYGQAIEAERQRSIALAGLQPIPVLAHGGPWIDDLALALGHLGREEWAAASVLRDAALDGAPDMPGVLVADGVDAAPFDWIADADPWFGPSMEVIVAGTWGLLPFDAVDSIKSAGARDLRDMVWFPVEIALRSGRSVAGMVPARYHRGEAVDHVRLRLGQATDWDDAGRGLGQRVLISSSGVEAGLLSLRSLTFEAVS